MKLRQPSIAKLLILVAVVAINLAAGRAVYDQDPEIGTFGGVTPAIFAMSTAFLLYIHRRGRAQSRAFLAGFLAFSLLALGFYIHSMLYPPTFRSIGRVWPGSEMTYPGSPAWHAWDRYGTVPMQFVRPYHGDPTDMRVSSIIFRAAVHYLPQGLFGLFGGLAGWLVVWSFRRRSRPAHAPLGESASSQLTA